MSNNCCKIQAARYSICMFLIVRLQIGLTFCHSFSFVHMEMRVVKAGACGWKVAVAIAAWTAPVPAPREVALRIEMILLPLLEGLPLFLAFGY